ncbi:MAG: hypothetical protein PHO70_06785 [Candidatus Omnitrophica bacterium]|nr:hypothetical protein [Candidatus Omnitrophota bacterium]
MVEGACIVTYESLVIIFNWIWPLIIGYGCTLFIGGFLIKFTLDEIKEKLYFSSFSINETKAYTWYARRVGDIEILLYITSFLINKPEFIAIWLALKVAGRWKSAQLEAAAIKTREERKAVKMLSAENRAVENFELIKSNGVYNIFTIGNGLSIIYGFVGSKIILWLRDFQWGKAMGLFLVTVIGNIVLYILARRQTMILEDLLKKAEK